VQLEVQFTNLTTTDKVHDESLLGPSEHLFIVAAFKVLFQRGRCVQVYTASSRYSHRQKVLLIGHPALLIVDNLAVAVKGEPIFNVPADTKDSHSLDGGH
jgi:hypothetical protein